jgi:hypothetical protein
VQFNWRASSDKWSVAECLVHLNVTAYEVLKKLRTAIDPARDQGLTGGVAEIAPGWFSRWFIGQMEPPPKRAFKAPAVFRVVPGSSYEKARVMGDFVAVGAKWQECIQLSRGLDLERVKVVSAASSLIKLPLGATFLVQTAHERRHLWQAAQVIKVPGFPKH